ncbi:MAG: KEOPS complex kinase/ATPase Bud32 [Thermoplasmata archaeon]
MPKTSESASPAARGAEATIRAVEWLGLDAYLKERDVKGYRPKALDDRLRNERTRMEVRLLVEARKLGVRTPIVYDVDLTTHRIVMERLPGTTLRDMLGAPAVTLATLDAPIVAFGRALGRLHAGGISHGDLTSSNVLYPDGPEAEPAFLDLSMGSRNGGIEELGIDLHLVEEDLKGLHPRGSALYKRFLDGYAEGNPAGHEKVRTRAREIRGRVRYA